ncbi:uncharacterized protein LOC119396967 [Rhipicephalus sanguineus]|uniref:uncharacterized protein LOC119396967 n=1 Tax=Rhipicephalus sanguineus TaxID=34632 RepID=UPI001892F043|nr:uncharacterized protein LOC119396967 [Rhipicephalus sanguineus]
MTTRTLWTVMRPCAPSQAVGLLLTASLLSGLAPCAWCCLPGLQDYDVCFNIFLERDFPLVEAFLLNRAFLSRGRVLVEPGDLETMCEGFGELLECYAFHYLNCADLGGVRREYFERLIKAMVSSFQLLCATNRTTLQNLFYDGHCIGSVSDGAGDCRTANFDLATAWKRIFRFRATQRDCSDLVRHTRCLVRALSSSSCRPEATTAYNTTAIDFLFVFCQQDFSDRSAASSGGLCSPSPLNIATVLVTLLSLLKARVH